MSFQANAFQADAFQSESALVGHRYDTGLAKPQRTLIRDAIVARLSLLLKSNGAYVTAVKPLPKMLSSISAVDVDDDGSFLFEALNGQAPGILVALGSKRYESAGGLGTEAQGTIDLEVYVVSQHQRGLVDGRLANDISVPNSKALDPGIETMLEHVEELLVGWKPAIETVDILRPTQEDELATFSNMTVWRQRYEIAVSRVINPARAITAVATSIEGRHRESALSLVPADPPFSLAPLITIATLSPEES